MYYAIACFPDAATARRAVETLQRADDDRVHLYAHVSTVKHLGGLVERGHPELPVEAVPDPSVPGALKEAIDRYHEPLRRGGVVVLLLSDDAERAQSAALALDRRGAGWPEPPPPAMTPEQAARELPYRGRAGVADDHEGWLQVGATHGTVKVSP